MNYFYGIHTKFMSVLMGVLFCSSSAEALYSNTGKLQIGIDGSNRVAAIWEASDSEQINTAIQASYGSSLTDDVIELTDPKLFHAHKPMIATSSSSRATTKAAAVWTARDLSTNHQVIQATILTALGWNTNPFTLSSNDGTEEPSNNDYKINISEDGNTIVVSWSSFFPNMLDSAACCAISTNGGLTWNKPEKLMKTQDSLSAQ